MKANLVILIREQLFRKDRGYYFKQLSLTILALLIICPPEIFAQDHLNYPAGDFIRFETGSISNKADAKSGWEPCISPFAELLGKGFFSLNIDFRKKQTYAISVGIAAIEEGIAPNIMGYFFAGERHRIEAGGGISGNIDQGSVINMFIHGVIGYRYQKKKGIFFRAGFTPMFVIPFDNEGKYAFIPWAGVSLGYSF